MMRFEHVLSDILYFFFGNSMISFAVFWLGGFALALLCALVIATPWLCGIPWRVATAIGGTLPAVVIFCANALPPRAFGRELGWALAFTAVLAALCATGGSLLTAYRQKSLFRRPLALAVLGCLLVAQLWVIWIMWLVSDPGFMSGT